MHMHEQRPLPLHTALYCTFVHFGDMSVDFVRFWGFGCRWGSLSRAWPPPPPLQSRCVVTARDRRALCVFFVPTLPPWGGSRRASRDMPLWCVCHRGTVCVRVFGRGDPDAISYMFVSSLPDRTRLTTGLSRCEP